MPNVLSLGMFANMDDPILQQCLQSRPQHTENIIRLFKCSPFFRDLMQGSTKKECFQLFISKEHCLLPHQSKACIPTFKTDQTLTQMMAHLRECKKQGLRHLIWWELGLGGDVLRSASSLAHWADQFLHVSILMAEHLLERRFGHMEGGRFCAIGLGKMGGMELNLGSDVDPIFIWDSTTEQSTGPKKIDARDYYARLSRLIIQLMSERTKDGIVWPVDMRLRPHGTTGSICLSLEATLMHYQYYGQTWERAMLIKARPSAGQLSLGDAFIEGIQPFIYRRYLDYTTVQALSEMKERIDACAAQSSIDVGFDVKRGRGGIREIEFSIQSLQLLHANKHPQLKIRNSMQALKVIEDLGLLSHIESQDLKRSYSLWRRIEHALQAQKGEQTHNLPEHYNDYLYQACLLEDPHMIMKKHADIVQAHFSKQFSSGIKKEDVVVNWLSFDTTQLQQYTPQDMDINALQQHLADIRNTLENSLLPERSQSQIQQILHTAMQSWIKDANLFLALQSFCQLLKSISGRATWVDLLAMHEGARTWLIGVLSASRYIAWHVASNPQWLEWPLEKEPIAKRIEKKIRQIHEVEGFDEQSIMTVGQHIDQVRLNCALAIDAQLSDAMHIARWLSDATDAAVQKVLEIALKQLDLEPNFGFICLAMGKHGSREMGLVSDLDMVFVLSHEDPAQLGPKNRSIRDWSQRLGRRMIQLLTLQRPYGLAYEFDSRLRPSGQSGILVTTLAAFKQYQHEQAQVWEHQALCRARTVAGPNDAQKKVQHIMHAVLHLKRDPAFVRAEVLRMREKMEKHLSSQTNQTINLKQDEGGLVDIEFLTQYARLLFGGGSGAATVENMFKQIPSSAPQAWFQAREKLASTYLLYREMENTLRVQLWKSVAKLPTDANSPEWESLRRHSDMQSPQALQERMAWVRQQFNALLAEDLLGAS